MNKTRLKTVDRSKASPYGQKGDETRRRIKRAAKHLFARHGVEDVTVRDIVVAAKQRNVGSLNYYFGSKEALLREVLIDSAKVMDAKCSRMLDDLEAAGGPKLLRQVIEILVLAMVETDDSDEDHSFARLCLKIAISNRALYLEALVGKADIGYRRCLAHIRRFVRHDNNALFAHRIHLMLNLMSIGLSIREDALEMSKAVRESMDSLFRSWAAPAAIDNLIDAMVGVIGQPLSAPALALAVKNESSRG